MELIDRYKGTLVGVHIGDAIGAPYETWKPQAIDKDIKKRGGLTFFDYQNPWIKDGNGKTLPAGRPTDDSDQTADLCHSLIECNGLNSDHLHEALRDSVVHNKSRLWSGKATGAGTTTRNALSADAKTTKLNGVPMNNIGTNGSLMRCSPMALYLGTIGKKKLIDRTKDKELVHSMSAVTHEHRHSKSACWMYTRWLINLLRGQKPEVILTSEPADWYSPLEQRVVLRLEDEYDLPYDPGAWPMRGTAEFSLYAAFYALLNSNSFAEGIEMAVRIGGDTDTYGAIAGGLLGAYYGYEGISEAWRKAILGHDQMIKYAEQLYEMQQHK